jgi:hypothetical protein
MTQRQHDCLDEMTEQEIDISTTATHTRTSAGTTGASLDSGFASNAPGAKPIAGGFRMLYSVF